MDRVVRFGFGLFMVVASSFAIVVAITKAWFVFDLFFLQTAMPAEVKNALSVLLVIATAAICLMCKEWAELIWRLLTGEED